MHIRASKHRRILQLAGLLGAVMACGHAMAQAAAASAPAAPTAADLADTQCAIGEERFLPADYYYCLGRQSYGEGRDQDALRFFRTAAGWGSKPAQYVLGVMALDGDHQPVDRTLALAWLALASERPDSRFRPAYEALRQHATQAEREAAERRLAGLRPVYADATAAVRAERRYAQGMAMLNRIDAEGGNYCMEGLGTLARPQNDPSLCQPVKTTIAAVDHAAAEVFDGWAGHVSVGPLQQVNGPVAGGQGARRP